MFVRILQKSRKMKGIMKVFILLLAAFVIGCQPAGDKSNVKKLKAEVKTTNENKMEHLTKATFQEKVFNYEVNKE